VLAHLSDSFGRYFRCGIAPAIADIRERGRDLLVRKFPRKAGHRTAGGVIDRHRATAAFQYSGYQALRIVSLDAGLPVRLEAS
jgi:hypothetical protein